MNEMEWWAMTSFIFTLFQWPLSLEWCYPVELLASFMQLLRYG